MHQNGGYMDREYPRISETMYNALVALVDHTKDDQTCIVELRESFYDIRNQYERYSFAPVNTDLSDNALIGEVEDHVDALQAKDALALLQDQIVEDARESGELY